jgi:hypothetical protein
MVFLDEAEDICGHPGDLVGLFWRHAVFGGKRENIKRYRGAAQLETAGGGEKGGERVREIGIIGEEGRPVNGRKRNVRGGVHSEGVGVCAENVLCEVEIEKSVALLEERSHKETETLLMVDRPLTGPPFPSFPCGSPFLTKYLLLY